MTKFKKFTALLIAVVLCMSLLLLTACDDGEMTYIADPETRPLTMSIQNPDGVFNPFFSTSAMDSNIIGMTQIGMLSSNASGEIVCGDNEPVVVKDYDVKTVTVDGKVYTDYSFIIKNGIKFSDGTPLTIKDVLFNLYVYLDPVYTGSSTIYSTDIVGLKAYRQQDDSVADDDSSSFEDGFILDAAARRSRLIEFVQAFGIYNPSASSGLVKPDKESFTADEVKSFQNDVAFVAKEFRKELESDWNNAALNDTYKKQGFTAKWQIFLYLDLGVDFFKMEADGVHYVKDEEGNRVVDAQKLADQEKELNEYMKDFNLDVNNEANVRNWAINSAFEMYFRAAIDGANYNEDAFNEQNIAATIASINADQFSLIVTSWATADVVLTQFIADAKSQQFGNGDKDVPTIRGITSSADGSVAKVTEDFHGNNLGEEHDVLKIRINNIDPKAIWNFAFTVAPLHYYSGTFEGVNYIETFNASTGNFGFKFGSKDFFDKVINASSKVGLPLGAGVYMASTVNGGVASSDSQFNDNNIIYYERNPYFETVGSGISNAKIKYFRYKVVESDQVINSITNGDIDIGEPNATPENIDWLDKNKIAHVEIQTAGYGYIGINPRFVPDVHVRRAIMKAMNRQLIKDNYYQRLCEIIERPMSTTNWAYPTGATTYKTSYTDKDGNLRDVTYDYVNDSVTGEEIEQLLESVGYYKGNDGVYTKGTSDTRLSYKFTIAGATTDHPAYAMFIQAQNLLNKHGFDINVVTSQQALTDLSAGKLAVWAAAWSSTIDPDMYQVYHKDSNASSVNNWGYPQIKANRAKYGFEAELMERLSAKIDEGRTTNDKDSRMEIYSDALDMVMEFAVELPTYQRYDMTAYNGNLLDRATMTANPSTYEGLVSRIWELDYLKVKAEA